MSDVEKYGLVAVVFVGGLLLVIAAQGGFGDDDATALAPEVIDSASPLRGAAADAGGNAVRVVSVLPDTPFQWDEPPVAYPGRRSASSAAVVEGESVSDVAPPLSGPRIVTALGTAPGVAGSGLPRSAPGTHVIKKGDTLSDIADQYLGSTARWKDLVALNPGLDPKNLKIGQVLRVSAGASGPSPETKLPKPQPMLAQPGSPPAVQAAPSPAAAATARTHTVVKGDTLGAIAKQYLGSSSRADEIFKANTKVLKSKHDLAVGQVLRIP